MLAHQIKTASDLRMFVESSGKCPYFFDRKSMKFFGDTMRNFGVCRCTIRTLGADDVPAFQLYRKRPVKYGNSKAFYFHAEQFHRIHEADEESAKRYRESVIANLPKLP